MPQTITKLSTRRLANLADSAGALSAEIARLTSQLDAIKGTLKDNGDGDYIGKTYKVVVTTSTRTGLDTAIVKGFLTPAEIILATKESTVQSACIKAL